MIEEKLNQHMIDSKTHQHMKCDINRNQIKQHMRDKTPIKNKITTRRKDTKMRLILDRNQVN